MTAYATGPISWNKTQAMIAQVVFRSVVGSNRIDPDKKIFSDSGSKHYAQATITQVTIAQAMVSNSQLVSINNKLSNQLVYRELEFLNIIIRLIYITKKKSLTFRLPPV
jgi:hypothetical protein